MRRLFLILSLIINISFVQAQQIVVPIDSLHHNDANGVPVDTGKVFTVSGIVTSTTNFSTSGPGSVQDSTGGICVYGSGFTSKVSMGDSVIVTARLTLYNGLDELDFFKGGASVVKISSNHVVEPKVITISQINSQQWNGNEKLEGLLVKVNNVSFSTTGAFLGDKSYTISDSTGSTTLRIDKDVASIINMPIPTEKIDIVGILQQYKYSAPYNSGYQILPRDIKDINNSLLPVILNPVLATEIDTTSFSVSFSTIKAGNSKVKYGLTLNLEMDSIIVNDSSTFHNIKINNLKPGTKYYFKAYSANEYGSSESQVLSATTATLDTTVGKINVYFNFSVDTTVAIPGNIAHGNVSFETKLIERINQAKYSIDMAVYSFLGMPNIASAIIAAKNRGVKVRVVYDSRDGNPLQNSMQALADAGIKISRRPDNNGIMHNKFFVFDERDTIPSNDWVWTGSWNVTSIEMDWKNNVIEINDKALADAYTIEFEEMWGSNNDDPNPALAKFASNKTDNTPHYFNIGGREVQLYFSPSDGTQNKILEQIIAADKSIYISQFAVTSNTLGSAIKNRFNAGVTDFKGVIDQINITGSEYNYFTTFGDVHPNPGSTLHHKYGIIDASYANCAPTVITGSHNWSNAANTDNDENTLIIKDYKIANLYLQEFKQRYNDAGGTGTFVVSVEDKNINQDKSFELYQNYPNPFNPITSIKFYSNNSQNVKINIVNTLGQKVKEIYSGMAKTGYTVVDVDCSNLSSGVYFYVLQTGNFVQTKKMVLLK